MVTRLSPVMTEVPAATGAGGGRLSSWIDYLTAPQSPVTPTRKDPFVNGMAPMPTEHMATLSINPPSAAAIGCGLHSKVSTVVAVGPANVELAARRAGALVETARGNNNVVTYVVLGVASAEDALAALTLPTPRVFLAGANELIALRARDERGPIREYLKEALLLAALPSSARDDADNGDDSLWVMPASPVPLDGSVPQLAPRTYKGAQRSLVLWQLALNTQWREWYARYNGTDTPLTPDEQALLAAYTSFPVMQRHPPLMGLSRTAQGLVGTIEGAPMGLVDHTIVWVSAAVRGESFWPCPCAQWATTGPPTLDGSVYWAVATWCHNTAAALRTLEPAIDTQHAFEDWEDDVKQTLLSLVVHRLPNGMQPYMTRVTKMRGVLGPVLLAGRGDRESMRVVHWTVDDQPRVTMLLPDSYVRTVLSDYNTGARPAEGQALLAAQGFYVLPRVDEVPLVLERFTEAELDSERIKYGPRLWIHSKARMPMTTELPDAPTRAMVVYRTQLDADRTPSEADGVLPGTRVVADATAQIYYTSTTSDDLLCGLRVCWNGNAGLPMLSVDTLEGGAQLAYESFL